MWLQQASVSGSQHLLVRLQNPLQKHTDCFSYRIPKHFNCHSMSQLMQALYAIKQQCKGHDGKDTLQ